MFFPVRDEGGMGGDWVNKGLIAANVIVFLIVLPMHKFFVFNYGTVPARVVEGEALYTLITSMFIHGDLLHLIGNMWYLWIFGDNIERALGHVRYLLFYLVAGIGGSLLHVATDIFSTTPAIGASGAISGVLGAYLLLFPRNRIDAVTTMGVMTHVQVSAKWMIGFWFFMQLFFSGFAVLGAQTGVAYLAHVGGFVSGYLMAAAFARWG